MTIDLAAGWRRTSARRGGRTSPSATCPRRRPAPAATTWCSRPRPAARCTTSVATIVPLGETIINSIEAEAGVRALAEKAGVAVAHVHLAREDGELVGGPFMISEFVPGETVPRRVLRLVAEHGIGELVADQLGETLARLHAIDPEAVDVPLRTLDVNAAGRQRPPWRRWCWRSTSCPSAGRCSSSGCAGSSGTCRRPRCAARSSTPTCATAT